jgi:hypothetical protein
MIYSIVGTHEGVRTKALQELARLGTVSHHIYTETALDLEKYIDATSLFENRIIVVCVQLSSSASSKETLISLLQRLEASSSIFIIDEPFADVHLTTRLAKVSKVIFDAKEEKIKDASVFTLCDSFAQRDKKQAWIDFMYLRDKGDAEAIQGALWWKFQRVWQGVREGKKSAFTIKDCERIGKELLESSILAHRGKRDLMVELEKIILSL